jgi:hypothetical protein
MNSFPSAGPLVAVTYDCGPVLLKISFADPALGEALHGLLSQYDAPWPAPKLFIQVTVGRSDVPSNVNESSGAYFRSYLLRVERRGDRLVSLSQNGTRMRFNFLTGEADISVPFHFDWPAIVEETEQQLVFLLARTWAQAGWTPLHAGSLLPPGENRCVLLCAPSGVGKTTLIAALLRRGWRTLGDDKTLLQVEGNGVVARALARRFHLHPASARWFPELGDFDDCPHYSRWTDKRVVRIEQAWPGRLIDSARPAAVVQLERITNGLEIEALDRMKTLYTLLRQVAIPSDPEHARPLVDCIGRLAVSVNSALVKIGDGIYDDPAAISRLENLLVGLLP